MSIYISNCMYIHIYIYMFFFRVIRYRAPRHDVECPRASTCALCHCLLFMRIAHWLGSWWLLFLCIRVHPPPAQLQSTPPNSYHFASHDFLAPKL